jgi:hypothetical protein
MSRTVQDRRYRSASTVGEQGAYTNSLQGVSKNVLGGQWQQLRLHRL